MLDLTNESKDLELYGNISPVGKKSIWQLSADSASPAMAEPTSAGAQAATFDPKTSPRTSSNAFFQETFIIFGHLTDQTDQCVRCKFTEHFLQGPTIYPARFPNSIGPGRRSFYCVHCLILVNLLVPWSHPA